MNLGLGSGACGCEGGDVVCGLGPDGRNIWSSLLTVGDPASKDGDSGGNEGDAGSSRLGR